MRILIVVISCLAAVSHAQIGRTLGRRVGVRRMLTPFGALPVPVVKEYVGVPVANRLLSRPSPIQYASNGIGYNRAMLADQYDPQGSFEGGYPGQFNGGIQQFPGQLNGRFGNGGYYNGYDPTEMAVDTPDYIERRRQRAGQSHLY
ncbi:hypothetical protein LOTGIDRAFT_233871 [Lottia gigantea]|uniref:Uncharacterized protein n=1 Tax=Lottia gigantea TaxID=225164 RepID=V4BNI2_LOTGI|nr:hypothetical protein LOTGIDRAFT_233871 [Lottia gigantea]ESO90399.1 hypothetical protein LOTGIDRAFT_233871 [Lottia gigantea]